MSTSFPAAAAALRNPTTWPWACPSCNLHKADRLDALDQESNALVPLFNPRGQNWDDHFRWDGYKAVGRTPVGRATIHVLDLNHPRRQLVRQAEQQFGLFPP